MCKVIHCDDGVNSNYPVNLDKVTYFHKVARISQILFKFGTYREVTWNFATHKERDAAFLQISKSIDIHEVSKTVSL